ncbi:hypothetical protein KAT63_02850 [Candidatus Parcubacteria bacterium]|nr:hypothetical protein [Candidatus Parcubacteria bacterium]
MKEITAYTLGYHDMFSARYGKLENLTVLQIGNMALAIEAPYHIIRSLFKMKDLKSKSSVTKIDALLVTHIDADHISGIDLLIWSKVFEENSKLLLITHPEVAEQIWHRIRTAFEISRIDMKTKLELKDYVDLVELKLGETVEIPQFGIEVETFHRSTHHAPFLSIAFRLLVDRTPILGYSGDTSFDQELIDFLAKNGDHPIIHEAGSYKKDSKAHTNIEELLTLPIEIQKRLYLNHIPFVLEEKILQRIKEASSPIHIANALNKITI